MRINEILREENVDNEYWVNKKHIYRVVEGVDGCITMIDDMGRNIKLLLSLEEIVYANYELVIDWTKVKVDTPILVREKDTQRWKKRYFAKYEDGKVYAWSCGSTSWSDDNANDMTGWQYATLYKGEGEE